MGRSPYSSVHIASTQARSTGGQSWPLSTEQLPQRERPSALVRSGKKPTISARPSSAFSRGQSAALKAPGRELGTRCQQVKTQRAQRFPAQTFVDTRPCPRLAFRAFRLGHSGVAQLVEQVTVNHRAAGSSPAAGAETSDLVAGYSAPWRWPEHSNYRHQARRLFRSRRGLARGSTPRGAARAPLDPRVWTGTPRRRALWPDRRLPLRSSRSPLPPG